MVTKQPFVGVRPAGWLGSEPAREVGEIIEWSIAVEGLGFDLIFVADRLLAEASGQGGLAVYDATMLDPFVMLSAIASRTTRVRLAPMVGVIPFRHPAVTAKLTASLDVVSDGRFVFGAGSGWSRPELRMFGIDPGRRGAQMEEGINLVRRLWTGETVTMRGEFWTLEDVRVAPRPVQRPGPPIWLGSFSPDDAITWGGDFTPGQVRALERIGRVADGWVPLTYSAGYKRQIESRQLGRGWEIISQAARNAHRDPVSIEIIYAHWIAIVDNDRQRQACEEGLARYFPGSYEEAVATYLIGTVDEIVERIAAQVSELQRIDGFLFTPISGDPGQLESIAGELAPQLVGIGG